MEDFTAGEQNNNVWEEKLQIMKIIMKIFKNKELMTHLHKLEKLNSEMK